MTWPQTAFRFKNPPFYSDPSEGDKKVSYSGKFNKLHRAILQNMWWLDDDKRQYSYLLDSNQIYYCKLNTFIAHTDFEKYPERYQDCFIAGEEADETKFFISYQFCSGLYLEDLNRQAPSTLVVFQLRQNKSNNFHHCIVRPMRKEWTVDWLKSIGAKEWNGKLEG